ILSLLFAVIRHRMLNKAAGTSAKRTAKRIALAASLALFIAAWMAAPYLMGAPRVGDAVQAQHEDLFGENYVDPQGVRVQPRHRRNLVVIYVESLEQSYDDAAKFSQNRITHLTELQNDNVTFGRYQQVANTGWTMGAMVSTMCGVPLKGIGLFTQNRF